MKHIKKYALPVLCVLASLLLVLGCEDASSNGDGDKKDTTNPTITGPSIASQNATSATVDLTVNEDATLFWVLYSGTDPAHTTAAQVVTASADTSAGVERKNDDTATANTKKSIALSNLSAGTYYFYVVARDAADNDALGTKLEITIAAAVTLEIDGTDDMGNLSFDVGYNCLRVYGDDECHESRDTIASGHVIGTLSNSYTGTGTVTYTLSDTTNFAITNTGELSFAVADPTINATDGITVTVTASDGTINDEATVTVYNNGSTGELGTGTNDNAGSAVMVVAGDGANGTNALQVTTSEEWGGLWFNSVADADISEFTSLNVSYKIASGPPLALRAKIESATTGDSICDEIFIPTIHDDTWREASLDLADFFDATTFVGCGSAPTATSTQNPGIWSTGGLSAAGATIFIDEYYYSTKPPADNVAPYFNGQPTLSGDGAGPTSADVTVTVNEEAKLYWVVYDKMDIPTPLDVDKIIDHAAPSSTTGVARGQIEMVGAHTPTTIKVTGLSASTDYRMYVAAEDLSDTSLKTDSDMLDFSTIAHTLTFDAEDYIFDFGTSCYRVYGDNDCGDPETMVAASAEVGVAVATHTGGGTITYALTEVDMTSTDAASFAIDSAGAITVGTTALSSLDSTAMYAFNVTATVGDLMATAMVTIINGMTIDITDTATFTTPYSLNGSITDGTFTTTETTTGTDGASSTANYYTLTRTGGNYGGAGWTGGDLLDLSGATNVNFSYKAADTAPDFFVKLEGPDGNSNNEIDVASITKDGSWQTGMVALSSFTNVDLANVSAPFLIFLKGDGSIDIDEIYIK